MKKETLEIWIAQLGNMIAILDTSDRLGGCIPEEKQALASIKNACHCFEKAIAEREPGIRIPPGYGVSSAIDRRIK